MSRLAPILDWNSQKWESKNKSMYEQAGQNTWPWFCEELDPDIIAILEGNKLTSGRALDVGTCSGYQAIGMAGRGFDVVATEVSESALADAIRNGESSPASDRISFVIDDIADSRLETDSFDVVLDRGCFHSICCFAPDDFVENIKRVTKADGLILIKAMSIEEDRFVQYDTIGSKKLPMPFRFTRAQLDGFFRESFSECEIRESAFYSNNISPPAKAWLAILRP